MPLLLIVLIGCFGSNGNKKNNQDDPVVVSAGEVTLDDVDAFGKVESAAWVHHRTDDWDQIVLTTVPDYCAKEEELQAAYEDLYDWNGDMEDYCEDVGEYIRAVSELAADMYAEDSHFLTLEVAKDGSQEIRDDGEYEEGDLYEGSTYYGYGEELSEDAVFSGGMFYYTDNLWAEVAEAWEDDGDPYDGCGAQDELEDMEDSIDYWGIANGTLDIVSLDNEDELTATLDAELEDEDGDDDGGIDATMTATYCSVSP